MQKRLGTRLRAVNIWLMAPLLGFALFLSVFVSLASPAIAATSSNLNFQARLLGNNGTIVADGTYNIDFKLYNADSTTGSVGTCSGACLWEETRKNSNSQGVQVINGYFSVNLGSVTAFPSTINWDQPLWLTMNIGGTSSGASPTWDGEMQNAGHSIALTALPYAFRAGTLAKTDGSGNVGTLSFNTVANNPNLLLPDVASGTLCVQGSTACNFINNQTSTQTANFNVQSAASGSIGGIIQGASGQSVDIFDIKANAVATPLLGVGSTGLLSLTPSANLSGNQSGIDQTITNGSAAGGTVNGFKQTITVSNSSSASNTNGLNISITDNTSVSANVNTGISITMAGSNSSNMVQYGVNATANRGIGLRGESTGHGGNLSCGNTSAAYSLGVCGASSDTANDAGVLGIISGANTTALTANSGGAGVQGYATANGSAAGVYAGLKGIANQSNAAAYTSVGVYGRGKGGAGASVYGGYFVLDASSTANAGSALYVSNSSIGANIVQFQDNTSDVFVLSDGGGLSVTPSDATKTIILGSTAQTGTITLGQSTATNTINIGSAAGNGSTQTINIGTSATAGSTTNVTVGSTIGSSATTINAGSGGISLGANTSLSSGKTLSLSNNTAAGLQVSNSSSSKTVVTIDTSGDQLILGQTGASGLTGKITFNNAANTNTVSIQAGTTTTGYTLTLPTALPGSSQCLQGDSSGTLSFTTCVTSAAVNTIGTYSSSNHYNFGANITGSTLTLGSADATHPGLIDSSAQTFAGDKTFNGTVAVGSGANSTTALQVQDTSNSDWLNVNTTDGYVISNGTDPLGNVIQNPGFEASGTTDGTGWYTPSATQVITNSSANAHGGNHELQVTGNSTTHAITTKYFAVHPGDIIYVEAYVKNSVGANGDAGIYVEYSDKDKGNATFTAMDTGLPGTSYILKSNTLTIPASKFYVRIAASVKATSSAGTFYFDDFYLKRVNEQAPLLLTSTSSTAFQVQNASAQTVLGVDSSNSRIFTTIADGASAIGFTFNTPSYTTAGAKLLSLQNNLVAKFSVDKDGNVTAAGGVAAGGDITTSGNVDIGSGKQFKVNGTQISSADLSNNSDLAKLAGTGPQIFTGDNKFSGTVLVQNANAAGFQVQNATDSVFMVDTSGNRIILGAASALTGSIQFQGSGGAGKLFLVGPTTPDAGNFTLSIPAITANANICTDNSICTGYASSTSLTSGLNGKLNKNAVDTSAASVTAVQGNLYAFTNNSNNIASGLIKLDNGNNTGNALTITGSNNDGGTNSYVVINNTNGTPTGSMLDIQANGVSKFNVDAAGNVTASGNISIATGKQYQINGTQISTSALSDGNVIAKTNANNTFSGNNTFSSVSNSFTGDGAGLTNLNAGNIATGTLNDGRLSSNVALLNRTGQTFIGDNVFAPTSANAGTVIRQTSSATASSGSVLDVQTADTTGHFLQITNAAANEGNVTLQSVGATRDLTIGSGSGTLKITAATNTIQHNNSSLTIDINNGTTSTLFVTNSQSGVAANLDVEGGINIGASNLYKIGGTQIDSTALSNNSDLAKRASSNTFTATNTISVTSATAFQVQNGGNAAVLIVDTSGRQIKVMENGGSTNYSLIYYDTSTSTANYTASTGTVAVGTGSGAITITAGSSSAVNITANAASTWKTTSGTLTLQSGSGTSDFLILNAGGSGQVQVNGSSTIKLGSASADPTCTNGAVYYNTTSSTFRGCQGGVWATLSSITPTLQSTYTQSTGGSTPEIKVDSTRGGVDIQDADSTIGGVIFAVRGSNAGGLGTSLFNVNTSTNSIQIGSSTTDSSAYILVLDSYNQSSDPSGINGGMYYNTSSGKFRCYENSAWKDCVSGFNTVTKTTDQAATQSTTTFQNDNTLQFGVAANTSYVFTAWIPVDDSNTSADLKYTFTTPAGAVLNILSSRYASATGNTICNITTSATACTETTVNIASMFIKVEGYVVTGGTSGTVNFQFAQNTSTAASFPVVKSGATLSWHTTN